MKFVKFGAFALALGMFAASCGNDTATSDTKTNDSTATMNATAAPMVDTTHMAAPPADTTHMSTTNNMAPAAGTDTGMKMKSTTTKTETKMDKKSTK